MTKVKLVLLPYVGSVYFIGKIERTLSSVDDFNALYAELKEIIFDKENGLSDSDNDCLGRLFNQFVKEFPIYYCGLSVNQWRAIFENYADTEYGIEFLIEPIDHTEETATRPLL